MKPDSNAHQWPLIFVVPFYSPICFGQETAKEPFGLRVKLPLVHLSTTHCVVFTLFFFLAERQARNRTQIYRFSNRRSTTDRCKFFSSKKKTSLPNSHLNTLEWPYVMFFCGKGRKKFPFGYQNDNTTSRDA